MIVRPRPFPGRLAGCAVLSAMVLGCSADTTSLRAGDPAGIRADAPVTLVIGVNETYCTKTACLCVHPVAVRHFEPLQLRLKADCGIDLELRYYPEDLFTLQKHVRAGELDGVLAKPWPILKCAREAGRNYLRIADLRGPDNGSALHGIAVVRRDSAIRTWADARGKRVALGQPDGYEKHHAAFALLKREGIDPSQVTVQQYSSCLENIGAILDGKADLAVVSDYAFDVDCLVDVARKEDFRVLGRTSPAIPAASLLLDMDRVPPETARRLQRALLGLAGDPGLRESLMGDGFTRPRPWAPPELPSLRR